MPTNIERDDKLEKKFVNNLPEDWRVRVLAMTTEELKAVVVEVASDENDNQKNKEDDIELTEVGNKFDELNAPYKDNSAIHKLKIKFALRELNRNGAI